ncbi:MAG: transposase [Candidatus Cryosericum sp.]
MTLSEGIYHVTARGNGDERIFEVNNDKYLLLDLLAATAAKEGWDIMAYCVMDNHYHLVTRTPLQNLSAGMHTINGSFGEVYNARHAHRGHVFQGRFYSVVFNSDSHLLEACRYTVLNPVRAGLVESPAAWPWSSYACSAFGNRGRVPVSDEMLLSMMGARGLPYSRAAYQEFIQAGVGLPRPDCLQRRREGRPSTLRQAMATLPCKMKKDEFGVAVALLRGQGRTLREIADAMGVSRMTVARSLDENGNRGLSHSLEN